MKHFALTRLRVEKDIVTRMKRSLKGKGQLKVSQGQQVSPEEIIGQSEISPGFRTINIATLLAVSPEDAGKYLTRKIGQRIYQGELLAYKKGWWGIGKRELTAPADGVVDFLNQKTGELRMTFLPKKTSLPAGVFGVVETVDTQRGQVIIRTQGTLVHGMFGSGRLRDGMLHILSKKDDLISKEAVESKYDNYVLVGGSLFFKDAIISAISAGVSGIITGGINAKDYRGMAGGRLIFPKKLDNDIGISIVICEGFGSIPMGSDIFEILSAYEGKFVSVDGNKAQVFLPSFSSASLTKIKNTKLPPIQDEEVFDPEYGKKIVELQKGLKVRIVGNSYPGEQGKLTAISDSLTLLPSGIKTDLATVETPRRKIQVPVANLEVIM